jgi:hypothetical protein
MFEAEESARRSAAQAASDSLDPFDVDVDLNCEDESDTSTETQESAAGARAPGAEERSEELEEEE